MIGETVGSYKVIEKLGEGGMGEVYLAQHKYIARRAAIKFLLPELTGSADVVSRFFAEARAASVIHHPGIVEVLDCDVHRDGRAYIVMEFLDGESLRAYLEGGGKMDGDAAGALAICRQIASALAAAHAQGIVHRDLKPDNVFLHLPSGRDSHQPIVKLLDFGIAKLVGGGEGGTKTRTGQLLGTPLYMSPEQCRGARQVDSRSDIYSFGCIMFEMFCGRPPFLAEGFGDLIIAHVSEAPPDPLELAPSMDPAVRETLLGCLEKAPEARPASMQALCERLAEIGAPDVVRLHNPVVPGTGPAGPIDSIRGRSRVSWNSPPALVATTPFPNSSRTETPAGRPPGAATPAPSVRTPPQIGTRMLPTPAPGTLSGGAAEILSREAPRRSSAKLVLASALAVGAVVAVIALRGPALIKGSPTVGPSTVAPTGEPGPPTGEPRAALPGPAGRREASPPASPPEASPRPSPASPPTSSIRLTGLPVGATIRLDGRPATAPIAVPRGAHTHLVTVEAEGYEAWERSVDGAADRTFAVQLTKKAPPGASAPKAKHRSEHRHGPSGFSGFTDL